MTWALHKFSAPLHVVWDITSRCLQTCEHCFNCSGPQADDLSDDKLVEIATYLAENKVARVYVTGGEPLLRQDILYGIVDMLKSAGIPCYLLTDGTQVTSDNADKIANMFEIIALPINAGTSDRHDAIAGYEGSFAAMKQAVKLLSAGSCRLEAVTVITNRNIDDFGNIVDACVDMKHIQRLSAATLVESGRALTNNLRLSLDQKQQFVEDFVQQKQRCEGQLSIEVSDPSKMLKALLSRRPPNSLMHIRANGLIGVTPWLPVVAGNVNYESLAELWQKISQFWVDPGVLKLLSGFVNANRLGFDHKRFIDPPLHISDLGQEKEAATDG